MCSYEQIIVFALTRLCKIGVIETNMYCGCENGNVRRERIHL
jgi:hypothetical protein